MISNNEYNKEYNTIEPGMIASFSQACSIGSKKNAPRKVRLSSFLLYPLKSSALAPPWPNEESLAHNQPVVCLLHHEPIRSEVAQVLLVPAKCAPSS